MDYIDNHKFGARNDCVVRAISTALDQPYEKIEKFLETFGRRKNCGTHTEIWYPLIEKYIEKEKKFNPQPTVGYLREMLPKDETYIISVSRHLLCIKNGKIYDSWDSSRTFVKAIYKIKKTRS